MPVFNQIIQESQGNFGSTGLQQLGPVFEAEIAVPAALQEMLTAAGRPIPAPVKGRALIDTGATFSAVDDRIMTQLGIPPVGLVQLGTAGGRQMANQYPAKFTLIVGGGSISFESPRATGVNISGQPYIALVGRDVLANVVMIYNGGMGFITIAV
jgi:hypothetical protein